VEKKEKKVEGTEDIQLGNRGKKEENCLDNLAYGHGRGASEKRT